MKSIINTYKFFLLLITLLFSSTLSAKESPDVLSKYDVIKLAENTWGVFGPLTSPNPENMGFMNNPTFVITEKSVVVIDPGSSVQIGRSLIKKINQHTDKPVTHIFNTHVHGDHWLANQAFVEANPSVKIYAHPEMIAEARAGQGLNWVNLMSALTQGATNGTKAIYPTIALKDQQEVKIDNITIKSHLNDFAHTRTDAMFQIVEDKILITGDNTFNKRMPRLDDGSYTGNIKAMDHGLSLDVDVVVPGHGPSGGKEVLKNYRDFLDIIYSSSIEMIEDDMEAFEMKPVIKEKLIKYQSWINFDNTIGKLISVAVLEAENEF